MDQAVHPSVLCVELLPEVAHVASVWCAARPRPGVVAVQGIGDEISGLQGPGSAGISEQRHIGQVPELAERAAGDAPLVGPVLQRALDAAVVVDDQSSLLEASAADPEHEVIELLGDELVGAELLAGRITLHDGSDETPRQFGVDGGVARYCSKGAVEDPPAVVWRDLC